MQDPQIHSEQKEDIQPGGADGLIGVCEAVGKDVGFDPFYLRIAMLALLIVEPLWMLGAYVALGIIVLVARWLIPDVEAEAATEAEARGDTVAANEQNNRGNLPIAA